MTWAASLAFYTTLSIAPILILILSVLSNLGAEFEASFKKQVFELFGEEALQIVFFVIENSKERGEFFSFYGLFGTLTLLFSASLVFSELKSALNNIYEVPPLEAKKNITMNFILYFKKRLLNIGIVFGFIFLMVLSLLVSTALTLIERLDLTLFENHYFIGLINHISSFIIYLVVFSVLYRFVPDRLTQWQISLYSAALSAVLFIVGQDLIGVYLGQSAIGSTYGAAGSLAVVLVWVYYSSIIIFIGAHFGHILQLHLFPQKKL